MTLEVFARGVDSYIDYCYNNGMAFPALQQLLIGFVDAGPVDMVLFPVKELPVFVGVWLRGALREGACRRQQAGGHKHGEDRGAVQERCHG
jgi:hypothetical protein